MSSTLGQALAIGKPEFLVFVINGVSHYIDKLWGYNLWCHYMKSM